MKIIAVTNNQNIYEELSSQGYCVRYFKGDSVTVLQKARDLVMEGWILAADALAGYNFRNNPYHTVFLQETEGNHEVKVYDILRLEQCMHVHQRKATEKGERIDRDYNSMDYSIAMNTFESIKKYQ